MKKLLLFIWIIVTAMYSTAQQKNVNVFQASINTPCTQMTLDNYKYLVEQAKKKKGLVVIANDLKSHSTNAGVQQEYVEVYHISGLSACYYTNGEGITSGAAANDLSKLTTPDTSWHQNTSYIVGKDSVTIRFAVWCSKGIKAGYKIRPVVIDTLGNGLAYLLETHWEGGFYTGHWQQFIDVKAKQPMKKFIYTVTIPFKLIVPFKIISIVQDFSVPDSPNVQQRKIVNAVIAKRKI